MNCGFTKFFWTLLLCLFAGASSAEVVTLSSASGGLTVTGKLLSYDGEVYEIETNTGPLTLADKGLKCRGSGCPSPQDRISAFSMIPSDRIPRKTLVDILKSFAKDNKKIFTQKGPFNKPDHVELSHRTEGLEAIISFARDDINLTFNTQQSDTAIGFDAVQIIGNAKVLNGRINTDTLRGILDGSISNWSELGGQDREIRLILPIFANDLFKTIARFYPDITPDNITDRVEFFLSREAIIQAIEDDDDAIGLIYQTSPSSSTIAIETSCGIMHTPSNFSIQSLEYPLSFQINISTNKTYLPQSAQRLKAYATTPLAQGLLSKTGIVPLVGEMITPDYQGKRFSDAIKTADRDTTINHLKAFTTFASTHTRLATTLYMSPNGRDFDERSVKLIGALAALLNTPDYANRDVIAVGFSDSSGDAKDNLTVSKRRADFAQAALADLGVTANSIGFGEIAPIGCNTTPFGKSQNRRVEIWVEN